MSLINIILFPLLFFALPSISLGIAPLDDLNARLRNIYELRAKDQKVQANIAAINVIAHLEDLKMSNPSDKAVFEILQKIIKTDDIPYLKFKDLYLALEAMQHVSLSERQTGMRQLLPQFFNELVLGQKEIQNIVVVGRTRGGKSTFLASLLDPLDINLNKKIAKDSIFSETVKSAHYGAIFKSWEQGLYIARLVDTPGLSEVKSIKSPLAARPDEVIIEDIAQSLEGLKIHRVFLLFPLTNGLNPQDIDAFKTIKKTLEERNIFRGPIDLVFPRADQGTAQYHAKLTEELLSIFDRYGIESSQYDKVLFSGTWFNNDFEMGFIDSVLASAARIMVLREKILNHIFGVKFGEYLRMNQDNKLDISSPTVDELKRLIPARTEDNAFSW